MRLGRSYTESVLRKPQVVFAQPSLGQQKLSVTLAGRVRRQERVTHPRISGPVLVFAPRPGPPIMVDTTRSRPRRTSYALNKPVVVSAQVGGFMAAPIVAVLSAVSTRATGIERFPLQGWEGSVTSLSPTAPSTPVLDNANRPNENPIAGGWGLGIGATSSRFQVASNIIRGTTASGNNDQVWGAVMPRDQEVFATNLSNSDLRLYLRVTAEATGSFNGYEVQFFISAGTVTLRSFVGAVNNFSWPTMHPTTAITSGDRVWVTINQTSATTALVNVYVDYGNLGDGNWKMIGSFIDAAVNPAFQGDGKIGAFLFDNSATRAFDNFGGGGIASIAPLGSLSRKLGPKPPLVLTAPPVVQTIVVASEQSVLRVAQNERYGPKSLLFPPTTLAQPPPNAPVSINCLQPDRLARRVDTRSFLLPPTVVAAAAVFVAAPVVVSLAAVQSRLVGTRRFPLQGWDGTPSESVAAPGSYVAAVLASSPSSWWRFNEPSGTTATDQGGGHTGTYTGNFVLNEGGQLTGETDTGISLGRLGGAADFVSMANGPIAMGQTNVTIEMWYTAKLPNQGGELWSERGTTDQWVLLSAAGTSLAGLAFRYVDDAGVTNVNNSLGGIIGDGSRKHIVLVKTGLTFDAYVDGVKTGTIPAGTLGPQTNTPITVKVGEGGGTTSMKGLFDEVAVYSRSLSATEIAAHYRAGAIGPKPPLQFVSRFLGPRPPRMILAIAPKELVVISTAELVGRDSIERRRPHSFLSVPQQLAQPPPSLSYGPSINGAAPPNGRRRRRPMLPVLGLPTVVRVPQVEQREQTIVTALARIRSRRQTTKLLSQPVVSSAAALSFGPSVTGAAPPNGRRRRRAMPPMLGAPTVVRVPQVEQREQTIVISLARIRPRRLAFVLGDPTALKVFAGPVVTLSHARPRPTTKVLSDPVVVSSSAAIFFGPSVTGATSSGRRRRRALAMVGAPVVVRVPSVEQQEDTVRVSLARTRPRRAIFSLLAPQATAVFAAGKPHLSTTRPRATAKVLRAPTAVVARAFENKLRISLASARPRLTANQLSIPVVVRSAQVDDSIRTTLAQSRPRPTDHFLGQPTALRVFSGPQVATAKIKPPRVIARVGKPTAVIPLPTLRAQTISVSLTASRTRVEQSRHQSHFELQPPTILSTAVAPTRKQQTLQVVLVGVRSGTEQKLHAGRFVLRPPTRVIPLPNQRAQTIGVYQPRIKPRPVTTKLSAPAKVIPPPTQRMQTVQVALAKARPRKTLAVLPETLGASTFVARAIATSLVRIKPKQTARRLVPPQVVRTPFDDTISVATVETRPRATRKFLSTPVVRYRPLETKTKTKLVAARPRPTVKRLGSPQALRTFPATPINSVETRPRPTRHFLGAPQKLLVASIEQARRTVGVSLVQTRPQPTTRRIFKPTVIRPAPVILVPLRVSPVVIRPQPTTTSLKPPLVLHDTRAVATTSATNPNQAAVSETEQAEAAVSSSLTGTIAETSLTEGAEATVSTTNPARAETEAD